MQPRARLFGFETPCRGHKPEHRSIAEFLGIESDQDGALFTIERLIDKSGGLYSMENLLEPWTATMEKWPYDQSVPTR